jgi:hypothetical protein
MSACGTFRTSHLHRRASAVGRKLAPRPRRNLRNSDLGLSQKHKTHGRRVCTKSHRSLDVLVGFQRERAVLFACKSHPARLPRPIDIWPDHVAVSPLLIARRTFRPSQTSTNMLKTARLLGLESNMH